MEVWLSEDDVITTSDTWAGAVTLDILGPGQCAELMVPTGAVTPDGAYYLGAIVDAVDELVELSETNNAMAGGEIGIGYGPDLVVSAVRGPDSAEPGGGFDAEVTVCNQGTEPSYWSDVELRLSTDANITATDLSAGIAPVPSLNPGQCTTVRVHAGVYVPDGAYYLGAIVDPYGWIPELIETNNAATGDLLGVGYLPDLVVSAVTGPKSALPGGNFDVEVSVCNQGTASSYGTEVELRLSTDARITTSDILTGNAPIPFLDPGQCTSVIVPASAYVPDGAYYLGAIVDPYGWIPELIETNNATAGGALNVAF